MSDRSAVAFRIMGARATLLGAEDSLEGINTFELDDGVLCYVTAQKTHYSLDKTSTASPSPPNTIKPVAGPGLWSVATGGTPGAQGFQGFQGAQGFQGTQGAGFQGAQGATGSQGNQGSQGTQGAGFQGAQGFQGATGVQGSIGAQGGPAGAQGATGAGFQGAQGSQGGNGAQGLQGLQGTQGAQGSQGTAGAQGNQGFQGARGAQGFQGLQGLQGTTGSQGATGAQGLQGLQGSQGTTGTQGTTGSQGSQGATGAGTQGAQGATGTQGSQGFQGTTGAGTQGSQGATGTQGNQGFQGATGAGSQGAQGFQGAAGTQGSQGFQGARGAQGFQGLQGLQGTTGSQGATGAQGLQGLQGNQGATGTQGLQGLQGLQGTTGSQGSQGSSAAAIAPLTQWFYVDSANAGAQTGSIAQPYVSPTAAFAAHTTGNITLAIAAGTYATALSLSGDRNITMIGLCEPGDQTVILGAVSVAFATNPGHTLTLQNLSVTTVASTSAVQDNISLIDTHASGTITGSGIAITNSSLFLSSVLPTGRLTGMRTEAITQFYQMTAENAYINGVISNMALLPTSTAGSQALAPKTFRGCTLAAAPTIGGYIAYDTTFLLTPTFPNAGTLNYFYDCIFTVGIGNAVAASDKVWVHGGRCTSGDPNSSDLLGNLGILYFYGTQFGPKTTGQTLVDINMNGLGMDASAEKSFWRPVTGGSGHMNGLNSSTANIYQALDEGEENGEPLGSTNRNLDASNGNTRFVYGYDSLAADTNATFSVASARALMFYTVDIWSTNAHTINLKFGATTLYSVTTGASFKPQRVRLQVTDDDLAVVFVGTENL